MTKASLKSYVNLMSNCDDYGQVVTLDQWIKWITQKKQEYARKSYLLQPWKTFVIMLSMIQLLTGVAGRIEKYYYCGESPNHPCPYVRPFHDTMIFKSCLRFEAWRYISHIFVHTGLPHLFSNLAVQLFFGN